MFGANGVPYRTMHHRTMHLLLVPLLVNFVPLCGAEQLRLESNADPAKIAEWVRLLGDQDFQVREQAEQELLRAGQPAVAELSKLREAENPEIRQRARRLLDQIDIAWGEAVAGVCLGMSPSSLALDEDQSKFTLHLWQKNTSKDEKKISVFEGSNFQGLVFKGKKSEQAFCWDPSVQFMVVSQMPAKETLKPGEIFKEDLTFAWAQLFGGLPELKAGEHLTLQAEIRIVIFGNFPGVEAWMSEKHVLEVSGQFPEKKYPNSGSVTIERTKEK